MLPPHQTIHIIKFNMLNLKIVYISLKIIIFGDVQTYTQTNYYGHKNANTLKSALEIT